MQILLNYPNISFFYELAEKQKLAFKNRKLEKFYGRIGQ